MQQQPGEGEAWERTRRRRWSAARLLLCGALALAAGCQFGQAVIEPCPLSWSEQRSRIEELVPLGTQRDEAIARLREAGIDGEFGASGRIYYCGLWDRPGGTRWQIDVALLFDAEGRLYELRPAQSEVRPITDSTATAAARGGNAGGRPGPATEPELRSRPR